MGEFPENLSIEALALLDKAKQKGKIRIGVNETTKAIERKKAKIVIIAQDVNPPEITMHLPVLCKEQGIPVAFVPEKKVLGEKAGIKVAASSIAIIDEGNAQKELEELLKKMQAKTKKTTEQKKEEK